MALAMHVISLLSSLASTSHQLARTSVPPSLALSSTTLCRHDTGHARHLAVVIVLAWSSPSHVSCRHRCCGCGPLHCRCCCCRRASPSPSPFLSSMSSLLSCLAIAAAAAIIVTVGVPCRRRHRHLVLPLQCALAVSSWQWLLTHHRRFRIPWPLSSSVHPLVILVIISSPVVVTVMHIPWSVTGPPLALSLLSITIGWHCPLVRPCLRQCI